MYRAASVACPIMERPLAAVNPTDQSAERERVAATPVAENGALLLERSIQGIGAGCLGQYRQALQFHAQPLGQLRITEILTDPECLKIRPECPRLPRGARRAGR